MLLKIDVKETLSPLYHAPKHLSKPFNKLPLYVSLTFLLKALKRHTVHTLD